MLEKAAEEGRERYTARQPTPAASPRPQPVEEPIPFTLPIAPASAHRSVFSPPLRSRTPPPAPQLSSSAGLFSPVTPGTRAAVPDTTLQSPSPIPPQSASYFSPSTSTTSASRIPDSVAPRLRGSVTPSVFERAEEPFEEDDLPQQG
ncbi:hypothetical protein JCM10213v2_002763 [Rhodosporidiobolus nylandii]